MKKSYQPSSIDGSAAKLFFLNVILSRNQQDLEVIGIGMLIKHIFSHLFCTADDSEEPIKLISYSRCSSQYV